MPEFSRLCAERAHALALLPATAVLVSAGILAVASFGAVQLPRLERLYGFFEDNNAALVLLQFSVLAIAATLAACGFAGYPQVLATLFILSARPCSSL